MSPRTRQIALVAWMAVLSFGLVAALARRAKSGPAAAYLDQLTVHRLNVVEPDGKPRVIISNDKEFPGMIWGGKEYRHPNRDTGGLFFYNDDGDEVGGMDSNARSRDGHYRADAGIRFDQYKQDQIVGVTYEDQDGKRAAGLTVWDRPSHSLGEILPLTDELARSKTAAEKHAIEQRAIAKMRSWGPDGDTRFFAGKADGQTVVRLADPQGRLRLLLLVDAKGDPSVEFLDQNGKITKRIMAN
jgi:hypothetical protein